MIQRNRLMSAADTERLWLWVTCLEMAVSRLLRGTDPGEALAYYHENIRAEPGPGSAAGDH